MKYLVWSNEHHAWWKPNFLGYTEKLDDAGRYSLQEAVAICNSSCLGMKTNNPLEIPVSVEAATRLAFAKGSK